MNADEFIALTPGKVVINRTGDTYTVVSGDAAGGASLWSGGRSSPTL